MPARTMLLLGLCYPVLAHVAAMSGHPALIATSLGLLGVLVLLPALINGRPAAWLALLVVALALHAAVDTGHALALLFLPPVLLNAFMAWLFGHTLRRGRMPLIERAARLMRGPEAPPDEAVVAYARNVTQVWTALFVVLALVNLVLALLARPGGLMLAAGLDSGLSVPIAAWSLFANVLNYLIVAALFVGEYAVRRRRFPQQSFRGLVDFTQRVLAMGHLFRPALPGAQQSRDTGPRGP